MLDSDGLTIGRLISNDVVLNHRAVSRTHAGVKEISGDFWLFNFSESNGTSLNGQLVGKTPLADGDVVQIGPYLLLINYVKQALAITVERQLEVQTAEGAVSLPVAPAGEEQTGATVMIKMPALPGSRTVTPFLTQRFRSRLCDVGLVTGLALESSGRLAREPEKRQKTPLLQAPGSNLQGPFNGGPRFRSEAVVAQSYFALGAVPRTRLFFPLASFCATRARTRPSSFLGPVSAPFSLRGIAGPPDEASCSIATASRRQC